MSDCLVYILALDRRTRGKGGNVAKQLGVHVDVTLSGIYNI